MWGISFSAALGMFVLGYGLPVLNTLQENISALMGWSEDEIPYYFGLASALNPLGAAIGAFVVGAMFADDQRRHIMIITDVVCIIGCGFTLIQDTLALMAGRFVVGLAIGANSVIVPIYINEITEKESKGFFGAFHQVMVYVGVMLAFMLGLGIPEPDDPDYITSNWWRIMLGLPIVTSLVRILAEVFLYTFEPPQYLLSIQKNEEAELIVRKLYKPEFVQEVLHFLVEDRDRAAAEGHISYYKLFTGFYRKAIVIGLMLAVFYQGSGLTAIKLYSNEIFKGHGKTVSNREATIYTSIMGCLNVIGAACSGIFIDKFGRKSLLLFGNGIIIGAWATAMYAAYIDSAIMIKVAIYIFIVTFATSLGPVFWIILPEILPSRGVSLCAVNSWFLAFVIAQVFPILFASGLGLAWTFSVFLVSSVACEIYCAVFLVETKGRSRTEVVALLSDTDKGPIKEGYGALGTQDDLHSNAAKANGGTENNTPGGETKPPAATNQRWIQKDLIGQNYQIIDCQLFTL
eukprot:TRINITY_DN9995_c0_g1_i11.p1 TRINITY_DN9995_c0_g1~~TRINITY_DN9995_c0_g1_i11.p1  ORF type:complete len:576 (+),score=103.14 TRINITY_DN9995_c0_g1_i11:180-1730(+)